MIRKFAQAARPPQRQLLLEDRRWHIQDWSAIHVCMETHGRDATGYFPGVANHCHFPTFSGGNRGAICAHAGYLLKFTSPWGATLSFKKLLLFRGRLTLQ